MSFKHLAGDTVILTQGGVWKTADLYSLDGALFAKWGGGFIRLRADGTTSKDGVNFTMLSTDQPIFADKFNRMTLSETPRRLQIENKKPEEL